MLSFAGQNLCEHALFWKPDVPDVWAVRCLSGMHEAPWLARETTEPSERLAVFAVS